MAQILTPASDVATGAWTTTPLWSKVDDDSTAQPTGDGTTITCPSGNESSNADLKLAAGGDPGVSTGHVMRVRWNKSGSRTLIANFQLWQGVPGTGTLIRTLQVQNLGTSEVESTVTLSAGQADSITDYTDLHVRLFYTYSGGGQPSEMIVDLVELETPDAQPQSYDETGKTFTITSTTSVTDVHKRPVEIKFASITDPADNTNHTLYLVMKYESGDSGTVDVELLQGSTVIESWLAQALTTTFTEYSFAVPEASAANITDYTDLRFRVTASDAGDLTPSISHAYFQLPEASGPQTYDETGKTFTVTATVTVADAATRVETGLAFTASESDSLTDAAVRDEVGAALTATTTITATDDVVRVYNESLSFTATSTTTGSDAAVRSEAATFTISESDSIVDTAVQDESGGAFTATATVSETDAQNYALDALAFTASTTITATDVPIKDETGKAFTATATVTATDAAVRAESLADTATAAVSVVDGQAYANDPLSFTVTSTSTSTESVVRGEAGLAFTINATVSETDGGAVLELGLTFTANATVSVTDLPVTDETGLALTATASLSESDVASRVEAEAFTINSTVSGTDEFVGGSETFDETGKTFTITGSLNVTDAAQIAENASETIVSTINVVDGAVRGEGALIATIVSTTSNSDQVTFAESINLSSVTTVSIADIQTSFDTLAFNIASIVSESDIYIPSGGAGGGNDLVDRGSEHRVMYSDVENDAMLARARPRLR